MNRLEPAVYRACHALAKMRALRPPIVNDRWLVWRYYLSMLAVAGIDLCFAVIYEIPLIHFMPTALILVAFTIGGAFFIFQPIQRYLFDSAGTPFPVRRIVTLSNVCTAYMAAVLSVLAVGKFLIVPEILNFDIADMLTQEERLWLPVIHTLYYTGLIYFVMLDYEAVLRAGIYSRDEKKVPAMRGHLLYRLLVTFSVTTLLPISVVALHVYTRDMTLERYLLAQYIVASVLALCVRVIFLTRSLIMPIRSLEKALLKARQNNLSATVAVLSNDETGRLAGGFNRMVRGLREQALIRETFGRYIPERVASAILSSSVDLKPRSTTATILYADIENFTALAGHLSPDQVVEMLNEYFSTAVELIENNNGVVTQFQGDAMLVTFKLPVEDAHHAASAIRAALDIQHSMRDAALREQNCGFELVLRPDKSSPVTSVRTIASLIQCMATR